MDRRAFLKIVGMGSVAITAGCTAEADKTLFSLVHAPDDMVTGKPVIALVPFFIVGFEFTISFAIFGNVVGLIHQMKLPEYKGLEQYAPRCSGHHFGITVSCKADDLEELKHFFQNNGDEVKIISNGFV